MQRAGPDGGGRDGISSRAPDLIPLFDPGSPEAVNEVFRFLQTQTAFFAQ